MMKAAFAVWDERIAPVFDVAREIHLVTVESGRIVEETRECIDTDRPMRRAIRLVETGADTLVCGAISRPLLILVAGHGIRVIPFVAGEFRDVVRAWIEGNIEGDSFAMPGCCGRGIRRHRGMTGLSREEHGMNNRGCGRMGSGSGNGRSGGNRQSARMNGGFAAGSEGWCVCPRCGRREAHDRGIPCTARTCPDCGTAMLRE